MKVRGYVEVVGAEVDNNADISNSRRKWAEAPGSQTEQLTNGAVSQRGPHSRDNRVEALYMCYSQRYAEPSSKLDEGYAVRDRARERLLNDHSYAGLQEWLSHDSVEAGGYRQNGQLGRVSLKNFSH